MPPGGITQRTGPCRPRAGELKMPYFLCSDGLALAAGHFDRYCFQPSITDIKSQISSMGPWIAQNLGKKVTLVYPDHAFGYTITATT